MTPSQARIRYDAELRKQAGQDLRLLSAIYHGTAPGVFKQGAQLFNKFAEFLRTEAEGKH